MRGWRPWKLRTAGDELPIEPRSVLVTTSTERNVNHDPDAAWVVRQFSTIPPGWQPPLTLIS
jgi:hypothetical protein